MRSTHSFSDQSYRAIKRPLRQSANSWEIAGFVQNAQDLNQSAAGGVTERTYSAMALVNPAFARRVAGIPTECSALTLNFTTPN